VAAVLYSIPARAAEKSPIEVIEDHSFFIEEAYNRSRRGAAHLYGGLQQRLTTTRLGV
jgi:hypothetical protein